MFSCVRKHVCCVCEPVCVLRCVEGDGNRKSTEHAGSKALR
jgi:hypothetical protein